MHCIGLEGNVGELVL